MSFESPMTFVRSLKGAPASVFLAFLFVRRPMTSRELQRWTGYGGDAVMEAVHLLVDLGWITALGPGGPWAMGVERQLPLMASLPGEDSEPARSAVPERSGARTDEQEKREDPEDKEDEHFVTALYTLYDAGVQEPTAGRLARLAHVSADYVTAHIEQANAQGFGLGVAIYRIEHAWPLPEKKPLLTVEERIKRFLADR